MLPPNDDQGPRRSRLEDRSFLLLVAIVSLAFAWVLLPMFGAILWGLIAAILFSPLNRRLSRRLSGRRNMAALGTVLIIVATVIVPAVVLGILVVEQLAALYAEIQAGQINFSGYFGQFQQLLPSWAQDLLNRFGLTDLGAIRDRIATGLVSSFQAVAAKAVSIGQSAFSFVVALGVMLYLTFFLLRDAEALQRHVAAAVPLRSEQWQALAEKFAAVVRATIKGSIAVGIAQGSIGGIVFWAIGIRPALLWGVLMAVLSLLPAIGTGLVWAPVAIYLMLTGAIAKALVLIFCGVFVIGTVDNILRPILVGRDARMPDYVVLVSTLGGIEVFGFSGIVIGPVIAAMFIATWNIFTQSRGAPAARRDFFRT
jgi:predicted PurR-regulated permease PerM